MATMITSECINCGACEPECPNTAIYQGGVEWQGPDGSMHAALATEIFYIVPEKCTECVGFHDQEACAAVCPVDCCVPNPEIPETHDVLLARARQLHADTTIPDDAPSRFTKAGTAGAHATETPQAASVAGAPAAPAPATAPVAPAATAQPPTPAPAPAPRAAASALAPGKVEKAVQTRAAIQATGPELADPFEEIVAGTGAVRRSGALSTLPLALLACGQGVLGALPAGMKARIEQTVGDTRFFRTQLATAANLFLNLALYPVVALAIGVAAGRASLFAGSASSWVLLGLTVACVEACWRLRETVLGRRPVAETPMRGAVYAPLVIPLGAMVLALVQRQGAESGVGFDGFYGDHDHFDEKLERARRYGEVYRLDDRAGAYVLRLELPRRVPPSTVGAALGLPKEMPDYEIDLALEAGAFRVTGRLVDPDVKKITGGAPAFPPTFTTRIALPEPVAGFQHRYADKILEVVLPKAPRS